MGFIAYWNFEINLSIYLSIAKKTVNLGEAHFIDISILVDNRHHSASDFQPWTVWTGANCINC